MFDSSCVLAKVVSMSKKKDAICYTKPEEPKFLKEIKQKLGYKEGPTVDDKRNLDKNFVSDDENDDDNVVKEKPEEQPQIVVLKEGDIDESEYKQLVKRAEATEDKRKIEAGEIKFKKPIKNSCDESESKDLNDSKNSRKRQHESSGDNNSKISTKNVKPIKESRLLSFVDDLEENDD
uniref:DUF4604 domain-containing protein n=1 Tax=Romanomermis culicivorax TaxID=13658 RepID=A0A915KT98_ROMCU